MDKLTTDIYNRQDWQPVQQSVHSEGTSLDQVPSLHKHIAGQLHGVNLDMGGGAYDKATQFLAQHGVKNLVYDPYNRPAQHNQQVMAAVAGGRADSVTIANVLNVIPEPAAQLQTLKEAADALKPGGTVYIDVYPGNGSGHPEKTSKGFQQNKPLQAYLPLVQQVFPQAKLTHSMIVAQNGGGQQQNYARVSDLIEQYAKLGPAAGQKNLFTPQVTKSGAMKKRWQEELHPRTGKGVGNGGKFQSKHGGGQQVRVVDHGTHHVAHVQHPHSGEFHQYKGHDHAHAVRKAAVGSQNQGFTIENPKPQAEMGGLFAGQQSTASNSHQRQVTHTSGESAGTKRPQTAPPQPRPQHTPPPAPRPKAQGGLFDNKQPQAPAPVAAKPPAAQPKPSNKPAASIDPKGQSPAPQHAGGGLFENPKEGDTKTEHGVDYVLRNSRWHRTHEQQLKDAHQQRAKDHESREQHKKNMAAMSAKAEKTAGPDEAMTEDEARKAIAGLSQELDYHNAITARAKKRRENKEPGTPGFTGPPEPDYQQKKESERAAFNKAYNDGVEERRKEKQKKDEDELQGNFMKPKAAEAPSEPKPELTKPLKKQASTRIEPSNPSSWTRPQLGHGLRGMVATRAKGGQAWQDMLGGRSEGAFQQEMSHWDMHYQGMALRASNDMGDPAMEDTVRDDIPLDNVPPLPGPTDRGYERALNSIKPGTVVSFPYHSGEEVFLRLESRNGKKQTFTVVKVPGGRENVRVGSKVKLHADQNNLFLGLVKPKDQPKGMPPVGTKSKKDWRDFDDGRYKPEGEGMFAAGNVDATKAANRANLSKPKEEKPFQLEGKASKWETPDSQKPDLPNQAPEKKATQSALFDAGKKEDLPGQEMLFDDPVDSDNSKTAESQARAAKDPHADALERGKKFTEYGPTYDRNIATSYGHYMNAKERGHSDKMLDQLHGELKTRLDARDARAGDAGITELKKHVDADGIEHKIFTSAKDPDGHVRVRMRDTDSGENVGIKTFPSQEAAEKEFAKNTKAASNKEMDDFVDKGKDEPKEVAGKYKHSDGDRVTINTPKDNNNDRHGQTGTIQGRSDSHLLDHVVKFDDGKTYEYHEDELQKAAEEKFMTASEAVMAGKPHGQWEQPISDAFVNERIDDDHPAMQGRDKVAMTDYFAAQKVANKVVHGTWAPEHNHGKVTGFSDDLKNAIVEREGFKQEIPVNGLEDTAKVLKHRKEYGKSSTGKHFEHLASTGGGSSFTSVASGKDYTEGVNKTLGMQDVGKDDIKLLMDTIPENEHRGLIDHIRKTKPDLESVAHDAAKERERENVMPKFQKAIDDAHEKQRQEMDDYVDGKDKPAADYGELDGHMKGLEKLKSAQAKADAGYQVGSSRARATSHAATQGNRAKQMDSKKDAMRRDVRSRLAKGEDVPQKYLDAVGSSVDYNDEGNHDPVGEKKADKKSLGYGDIVKTKDGVVGRMRGGNGLGGNRVGVIDEKGNKHFASRDELSTPESHETEGKTFPQQVGEQQEEKPKLNEREQAEHDKWTNRKADIEAQIEKVSGFQGTSDSARASEHFHLGVLDSGKKTSRAEGKRRARDLDKTIDNAKKHVELMSDLNRANARIKHVESGKFEQAALQTDKNREKKANRVPQDNNSTRKVGVNLRQGGHTLEDGTKLSWSSDMSDEMNPTGELNFEAPDGKKWKVNTGEFPGTHKSVKAAQAIVKKHLAEQAKATANKEMDEYVNTAKNEPADYDKRVRAEEAKGMTRGDAQGVVDAEIMQENRKKTEAPESKPAATFNAEKHGGYKPMMQMAGDIDAGKMTADEFKAAHKMMHESSDAFRADLQSRYNAKELKNIAGHLHDWNAKTNTKAENAASVYKRLMENTFDIGDGMSRTWSMGEMRDPDGHSKRLAGHVAKQTDETMASHVEDRKKATAEREEANKASAAALENPQKLDDFKRVERQAEGYANMKPEHQEKYDELHTEHTRGQRDEAKKPTEVKGFQSTEEDHFGESKIIEGHHTKQDKPTFTVQVGNRVSREKYNELKPKLRQMGGRHVNSRTAARYNAAEGFQFFNKEDAENFQKIIGGEDVDRSGRLDRRKEEREKTVSEKLTAHADRLEGRGADAHGADRKENTHKRAREAASARASAAHDMNQAKRLRSVSEAMDAGKANHLNGMSALTHMETLQSVWKQANRTYLEKQLEDKHGEDWQRKASHDERENAWQQSELEDGAIAHVKMPRQVIYKNNVAGYLQKAASTTGLKMDAKRWMKRFEKTSNSVDKDHFTMSKEATREWFEFAKKAKRKGVSHDWGGFGEKDTFQRLYAMGIQEDHELRAALREFSPHQSQKDGRGKVDPVEALEKKLHLEHKAEGFYPTPPQASDRAVELADIQDGHDVYEPHAGSGRLMDAIKAKHGDSVKLSGGEMHGSLMELLKMKGHDVTQGDFLEHKGQHDRIVMNPPFENNQAIDHVQHGFKQLAPGGKLVAVVPGNDRLYRDATQKKRKAFSDFVDEHGEFEELPAGSFKGSDAPRQTGVNTSYVVLTKPGTENYSRNVFTELLQSIDQTDVITAYVDQYFRDEWWVYTPEPSLSAAVDQYAQNTLSQNLVGGATDMAISPWGKSRAFNRMIKSAFGAWQGRNAGQQSPQHTDLETRHGLDPGQGHRMLQEHARRSARAELKGQGQQPSQGSPHQGLTAGQQKRQQEGSYYEPPAPEWKGPNDAATPDPQKQFDFNSGPAARAPVSGGGDPARPGGRPPAEYRPGSIGDQLQSKRMGEDTPSRQREPGRPPAEYRPGSIGDRLQRGQKGIEQPQQAQQQAQQQPQPAAEDKPFALPKDIKSGSVEAQALEYEHKSKQNAAGGRKLPPGTFKPAPAAAPQSPGAPPTPWRDIPTAADPFEGPGGEERSKAYDEMMKAGVAPWPGAMNTPAMQRNPKGAAMPPAGAEGPSNKSFEDLHPRGKEGQHDGGKFVKKGAEGAGAPSEEAPPQMSPEQVHQMQQQQAAQAAAVERKKAVEMEPLGVRVNGEKPGGQQPWEKSGNISKGGGMSEVHVDSSRKNQPAMLTDEEREAEFNRSAQLRRELADRDARNAAKAEFNKLPKAAAAGDSGLAQPNPDDFRGADGRVNEMSYTDADGNKVEGFRDAMKKWRSKERQHDNRRQDQHQDKIKAAASSAGVDAVELHQIAQQTHEMHMAQHKEWSPIVRQAQQLVSQSKAANIENSRDRDGAGDYSNVAGFDDMLDEMMSNNPHLDWGDNPSDTLWQKIKDGGKAPTISDDKVLKESLDYLYDHGSGDEPVNYLDNDPEGYVPPDPNDPDAVPFSRHSDLTAILDRYMRPYCVAS
jgi:hypothetical protein